MTSHASHSSDGPPKLVELPFDKSIRAKLAPHLGNVFLDRVGDGRWQLTNVLTIEKVMLPGDFTYSLIHDDDGFAALEKQSLSEVEKEPDIDLVEDMFALQAYISDDDELFVYTCKGKKAGSTFWVSDMLRKYQEHTVEVKLASFDATSEFTIAKFKWHRTCATIFFSTKDLYQRLGLKQFAKYPYRWHLSGYERWVKFMDEQGLPKHVLPSQRVAGLLLAICIYVL